jgi:acyl-CoA hydrolase
MSASDGANKKELVIRPVPTCLIDIVFPTDTNHHGTFFGGAAFALMDRVAFIAATRHGRVPFVTGSCERIDFKAPAKVGQIVEVMARPLWAGRKSLTVEVEMTAEDIVGGKRNLCTRGLFNMVAIPGEDVPADWCIADLPYGVDPGPVVGETKMTEIVFADQANAFGKLFGGEAIAVMTKTAFVCATRYSGRPTVVASSRQVNFHHTVEVGSIIDTVARVKSTGRTSMVVSVELWSEQIISGERRLAAQGEFVMVAVDEESRPTPFETSDIARSQFIQDLKDSILPIARDRV